MDAVSAGLTIFRHHLIGFCLELVFSLLIKKKIRNCQILKCKKKMSIFEYILKCN